MPIDLKNKIVPQLCSLLSIPFQVVFKITEMEGHRYFMNNLVDQIGLLALYLQQDMTIAIETTTILGK